MDIKVLGPGCAKCKTTADLINRVATEVGKSVNIQKIENMRQIANYGVMQPLPPVGLPALAQLASPDKA